MKPEMKETIAAAARAFQLPAYPDIPDVGLYLEQTVKYVNGYLEPLHGMELTASMVSNYVKKGIIAKPVRKQYHRDQIACLFFVAVAKISMSMEDIDLLFLLQHQALIELSQHLLHQVLKVQILQQRVLVRSQLQE